MTVDCTCASSLTREQALKRLAAVEPLPRGERPTVVDWKKRANTVNARDGRSDMWTNLGNSLWNDTESGAEAERQSRAWLKRVGELCLEAAAAPVPPSDGGA